MSTTVRMGSYRSRRSGQEDPQAKYVDFGPVRVYFSYTTAVAFHADGRPLVIRENDWSRTTGGHLVAIEEMHGRRDRREAAKQRIGGAEFEKQLASLIGRFFFPTDLDKDTPPYVVADWLRERGLDAAADAIQMTAV